VDALFAGRTGQPLDMDGELGRIAAAQGGFCYRWQALDCGYGEGEISALLRTKEWVRIRRGAYSPAELVADLDPAGLHVLMVRAVVGSLDGRVVVTHHSALALLGVPMWGVDLSEVHVHRTEGKSSRRDAGVVHHLGALPDEEVREVDGLLVSVPERGVVDAARTVPYDAGVVLADGTRHRMPFDMERAEAILERQRDWKGSVVASRVLRFSDGRAETVGESRSRLLMARIGLPAPALQKKLYDAHGELIGIADLYVEEYQTAVEFDGKQKYGRAMYEKSNDPGDVDLGEVVWLEKRREDNIREAGNEMVRLVWSELDGHDGRVRARFLRAFDRSGKRRSA
jgi:hypothetical protein